LILSKLTQAASNKEMASTGPTSSHKGDTANSPLLFSAADTNTWQPVVLLKKPKRLGLYKEDDSPL